MYLLEIRDLYDETGGLTWKGLPYRPVSISYICPKVITFVLVSQLNYSIDTG